MTLQINVGLYRGNANDFHAKFWICNALDQSLGRALLRVFRVFDKLVQKVKQLRPWQNQGSSRGYPQCCADTANAGQPNELERIATW